VETNSDTPTFAAPRADPSKRKNSSVFIYGNCNEKVLAPRRSN